MNLYLVIGAGAGAFLLFEASTWLLSRLGGPEKALRNFVDSPQTPLETVASDSQTFKIRLGLQQLGLAAPGHEEAFFYGAVLGLGLLLGIPLLGLGLPPVTGLAGPGLAWVLLQGWLATRLQQHRHALESEIPTFLMRLAGMLQASSDPMQALDEITASLDPDKPLQSWLQAFLHELQTQGGRGLDAKEAEARLLSSGLLLVVLQLRRLWETGGEGYAQAFELAAEHFSALLATRSLAQAKAGGAWGTARIVILGAALSLGFIMFNPTSQAMFLSNPLTQFGLVGLVLWGGLGWKIINELVQEVIA